ncbi:radical SAM protein [Rhizobium ruizarguesonis]
MASVALINPPNRLTPDLPGSPIALGYLASFLEKRGHSVDIFDFERAVDAEAEILTSIDFGKYLLVGFGTFTHTFDKCLALAKALKARYRTAKIVVGGHHATPLGREIIEDFDFIDFCICGEGEHALLALVEALAANVHDFSSVESLVWRLAGSVRVNPLRELEPNLDLFSHPKRVVANDWSMNQLPWFFDHNDRGGRRYLNAISSRGCPYKCNYCAIPTLIGRKTRTRSITDVIEEIVACSQQSDFEHIFFQDPNFFTNHKHALDLATALHEILPDVTFSFETRSDQICRKQETIEKLAKLGCLAITMGLESASPSVLARLNKCATPDQNEMALAILRRCNIRPQLYLIMFDPESTLDDLQLNLDFLRRNNLIGFLPHPYILYDRLQPMPGTEYWDYYKEKFGIPNVHRIPEPLFIDAQVDAVWRSVNAFRQQFDSNLSIQLDAIFRCKSLEKRRDSATFSLSRSRVLQQLDLASIELRYMPYNIFIAAFERAKSGDRNFLLEDLSWGPSPMNSAQLPALFDRNQALIDEMREAAGSIAPDAMEFAELQSVEGAVPA